MLDKHSSKYLSENRNNIRKNILTSEQLKLHTTINNWCMLCPYIEDLVCSGVGSMHIGLVDEDSNRVFTTSNLRNLVFKEDILSLVITPRNTYKPIIIELDTIDSTLVSIGNNKYQINDLLYQLVDKGFQ